MKVCIFLCLVFLAGCQGNSFTDGLKSVFHSIGDAFTTTFKQVGDQAKTVGEGLLDQLKTSGTQLAGQALQSLLLGATSALSGSGSGGTKRELQLQEELKHFIGGKVDKMHEVFHSAVDALSQMGANTHSSELVSLVSTVDEVVHSHNAVLNNLLHELVEGVQKHFEQAVQHLPHHKRSAFTDLLSNVGQSVAAFFQPHVQGLKQIVGALGQGVTQTSQQMHTQVQPHVDSIKGSSQALLQHGKNALSALKDAVTDILHQTLTNMQPHLQNIAQHAGQIATQSAGTLATNLGKTVLNALGAAATTMAP